MSLVTKSARKVPRCRGCGEPTKGHAGPTGPARCQNQGAPPDINQNSSTKHGDADGDTAVMAVKVLPVDFTKLKLVSDSHVDNPSDKPKAKLNRHVGFEVDVSQENDESLVFGDPGLHESIDRCIATLSLEDDVQEGGVAVESSFLDSSCNLSVAGEEHDHEPMEEAKAMQEGVAEEEHESMVEESKSVQVEDHKSVDVNTPRLSQCDNEEFLSQSTLEDLDSLLKIDEKTLIQKRLAPERMPSSSDNDMDIRKVLAGNAFQLCECVRGDGVCDCKGLLNLNGEMEGDLENVFMDPLSDGENDFAPTVRTKKSSWKKKSPNEMVLYLDSVTACGVSSSKGEVKMKALRFVEMVKGKKVLSVEIEAQIELSIRVNQLYTKRGYGSPITFSRKFKLIEVEEEVPSEDAQEEDVVFDDVEKAQEKNASIRKPYVTNDESEDDLEKAEEKSAPSREPYITYDVSKDGQLAYVPYEDDATVTKKGITGVGKKDEDDTENGEDGESEWDDIEDEDLNEQDSEDEVDKNDTLDGESDSASDKKTNDSSDDEEDIDQTKDSLTEEDLDNTRGNASSDEDGCEEESWIEESLDDTNDDLNDMDCESRV